MNTLNNYMERKMETFRSLELNEEYIECKVDLPLAILKIKKDAFKNIVSIDKNRETHAWLENANNVEEVKAILIIADEFSLSEKNYHNFLAHISGKKTENFSPEETRLIAETTERAIELNSIANYVRQFTKLNKLIISCMSGEVVTPFFGLSLLTDLRFGSENMTFLLSHLKYGIHPSGLLPLMLPKHIGFGKAMNYLISGGKINAAEAFELGLLSRVFSKANFEKQCIEEAKRISLNSQNVIHSTKELFYNFNNELEDYIHEEDARYTYC